MKTFVRWSFIVLFFLLIVAALWLGALYLLVEWKAG